MWADKEISNLKVRLYDIQTKIVCLEHDLEIQRQLACLKCRTQSKTRDKLSRYSDKKSLYDFLQDMEEIKEKIRFWESEKKECEERLQILEYEKECPFVEPTEDELTKMFEYFAKEFSVNHSSRICGEARS